MLKVLRLATVRNLCLAHGFSIEKGGEKLYLGPAIRWRREKQGTTVHIRDAFYNVCLSPVLVEQRHQYHSRHIIHYLAARSPTLSPFTPSHPGNY